MVLDKEIDNLHKILNPKSEKSEFVREVERKFLDKYHGLKRDIKKALKLPKSEMKKRFANHPQYEVIALCHKRKDLSELDEWLKKQTKKLKGAKKFLGL
jgi:RNA ligase